MGHHHSPLAFCRRDPLEEAVRGQVRAFIEQLLEEELEAALGRRGSEGRWLEPVDAMTGDGGN